MLTTPVKYIGLDLETTGANHRLHKVIQVGICSKDKTGQPVMVRSDIFQELYRYEEKALQVNKFTHERIAAARKWGDVEPELVEFLNIYAPEPKRLRAVGWNVGSFDLQFITQESAALSDRLHYRHVDLNGVNDTLALLVQRDSDKLKKEAKVYAEKMISTYLPELVQVTTVEGNDQPVQQWHDAGYDAAASLYSWQWYLDFMKSNRYIYSIMRNRVIDLDGLNG